MERNFKGIFPALITPFDREDRVNTGALGQLIEMLLGQGVAGFYVDGSTAEAFLMSFDERRTVIETAAAANAGRGTMIAQVGCISTKQSVELARFAQQCGYHAISSVAPFYYKFSFEEIRRYYFDLADAVDLPLIIYNIPAFSGVNLSVSQMGQFLSDPRFIGVKHTSPDYFALRQFKTAFPDKYMLNGFDETFLAGLSMGADGAIGSTYNFMAPTFVRIHDLFLRGEIRAAAALQEKADRVIAVLCKYGVMQGVKVILTRIGIPAGVARAPFIDLTEAQKDELWAAFLAL